MHYFKIDYNQWRLLKDPETGELVDPVPPEDFDKFEYWCDEQNKPVRQVIPKNGQPLYADFLNVRTGKLERKVSALLGVSAYDDEISKALYEELCQSTLLQHHYHIHIDTGALLPYQRPALQFYKFEDGAFIEKAKKLYTVNLEAKRVEAISKPDKAIVNLGIAISEFEFYSFVIQKLMDTHHIEL